MVHKFKSKTKIPFIVTAIQYDGTNKDDLVQFFGNLEFYEVKDESNNIPYIHFKQDNETWLRIGKHDFAIKYEDTGKYYAFSPDVFFLNYKAINK